MQPHGTFLHIRVSDDRDEWTETHYNLAPVSHHLFEGVLYGSYHQALMLDLLLREEARRRRGAARGTRCSCGAAQRSGPRQGSVRAWGVTLEVGVVVGLLAQDGRGRGGHVAQDLDDGLELAGDVVLKKAGGHNCCT